MVLSGIVPQKFKRRSYRPARRWACKQATNGEYFHSTYIKKAGGGTHKLLAMLRSISTCVIPWKYLTIWFPTFYHVFIATRIFYNERWDKRTHKQITIRFIQNDLWLLIATRGFWVSCQSARHRIGELFWNKYRRLSFSRRQEIYFGYMQSPIQWCQSHEKIGEHVENTQVLGLSSKNISPILILSRRRHVCQNKSQLSPISIVSRIL